MMASSAENEWRALTGRPHFCGTGLFFVRFVKQVPTGLQRLRCEHFHIEGPQALQILYLSNLVIKREPATPNLATGAGSISS
jgi:hypothetical protein